MARRKAPAIPDDLLDQLLAGGDAATALNSGDLVNALKKALAERVLSAEMDCHLSDEAEVENSRNGYGRKSVSTGTGKIEIGAIRRPARSWAEVPCQENRSQSLAVRSSRPASQSLGSRPPQHPGRSSDQTPAPHAPATVSSTRRSGSGEPGGGSPNRPPSPAPAALPKQPSPSMPRQSSVCFGS